MANNGPEIDTIYALTTAAGRSGVAIIRASGPEAKDGLLRLSGLDGPPEPRYATYCVLSDPEAGEVIDRAVAIYFAGPASFTGDDVVEYQIHGGRAVINGMLGALSRCAGHRMADPGEFTRRAFENGKVDLTEAEAIADLIDAETKWQKTQALSQMEGGLSDLYEGWRERLIESQAYIEADIDFSDEDLPDDINAKRHAEIRNIIGEIRGHLADNGRGERLRDGIKVVVVGAPNVGKSSLVNVLSQRDIAIVSDQAGTTRDVIEAHLDLSGYPVILADTAGLRPDQLVNKEGQSAIEFEGIRRALKRAESADILVLMFDANDLPELEPNSMALVDDRSIVAFNKSEKYKGDFPKIEGQTPICLSVKENIGIDDLTQAITTKIEALMEPKETPFLTRKRHREALERCCESLERALEAPLPELMAEDIRMAARDLGRITGRIDVEDLLDVIFNDFCIGK
jgi:tRNA modification GTPase